MFAGLFTVGAAIADWEWFMQHPKSVFWVKLFGRNGARTFYFLLGTAIAVLAFQFC
ncbi:MAG: immunity 17 family protein [Gammaproteobacteria bacterium]